MAKGRRLLSLAVRAEHKKRIQFKSLSSLVELELGRRRCSCLCSQVHGVVLLSPELLPPPLAPLLGVATGGMKPGAPACPSQRDCRFSNKCRSPVGSSPLAVLPAGPGPVLGAVSPALPHRGGRSLRTLRLLLAMGWDPCPGKTEGLCSVNWEGSGFIPGQWPVGIFVG